MCIGSVNSNNYITFPDAKILLIDLRPCHILNYIKKHLLWSVLELLNNCIDGLSILKVNVIVGVFGLAISMALELICIQSLHSKF